jgi:hypothetical protein
MWFATPFIIGLFHPLHLAGFDRRTEAIMHFRGFSAALSALGLLELRPEDRTPSAGWRRARGYR